MQEENFLNKNIPLVWKLKGKSPIGAISEIKLKNSVRVGIFQGSKGQKPDLDIVIKYLDLNKSNRLRTPKHIHWVIDLLIKKQHNRHLTMDFIMYLYKMWHNLQPLTTKSEQLEILERLSPKKDLEKFDELNKYGEYSVEFIAYVIELFVIEEKTGMKGAFMFKELFDSLLMEKDIFYVVSKATHNGRL